MLWPALDFRSFRVKKKRDNNKKEKDDYGLRSIFLADMKITTEP